MSSNDRSDRDVEPEEAKHSRYQGLRAAAHSTCTRSFASCSASSCERESVSVFGFQYGLSPATASPPETIPNIAPEFYVEYRRADVSPYRESAPLTNDWKNFDFAVEDGVATVTFNRPDKLNALTFGTYADLRDLLTELPQHKDVKVLVITGTGKGFCSGGDVEEIIAELLKLETHELLEFTRMTGAVVKALREIPIPVIAAVNGTAAGAGTVIALAADFRLLSPTRRSHSCSRESGSPAPTWAPRTCCRGSSGSAARPSC